MGCPFVYCSIKKKKKKNQFQRYVANNGQEETWFIWLFFCRCCACFTKREKEIAITKENRSHCLAALFEKKNFWRDLPLNITTPVFLFSLRWVVLKWRVCVVVDSLTCEFFFFFFDSRMTGVVPASAQEKRHWSQGTHGYAQTNVHKWNTQKKKGKKVGTRKHTKNTMQLKRKKCERKKMKRGT